MEGFTLTIITSRCFKKRLVLCENPKYISKRRSKLMDNKSSMSRVERLHREKVTRYSIRKYSFGAASVAVAALFMFLGNGAVSANELSKQDTPSVEAPAPASEDKPNSVESTPTVQAISEESTAKPAEAVTPALNKTQLESYISEIETKLSNGSYDNKTEESVAELKADLVAAKTTLVNATTQDELTKAYRKLFTTVNSKLKNKPVEKKETPVVDTTNGKETVGKKAENTEKNPESNSIENTGSNDPRNRQAIPTGIQFRAEVAYSEGTNAEPNGHSDTYIINDVDGQTSSASAAQAVSRVTNYKVKYNKDDSGKITSLDWLVFYNDHLENLANKYGTDGGDVYRNYIQIPAEVNMPTAITRLKYNSPVDPKWNPQTRKFQRILPDGSALSSSVTFENPSPDTAGGLRLDKKDTFALASGWESTLYGRAIEKLAGQEERYFKSAATDSSPRTKQLVYGAALNDKRLIVDRSTTGGNGYDGYVWNFRTEVPETTTNEQLKDMKVVFGMMRSATAGANAAFANIATNPVKMWQSDLYPPTAKDQTVKAGQQPDAKKSIANLDTLPKGTTVKYKEEVDTQSPGEKQATAVVTYPDTSTKEVPVKVIVENEAVAAPVVNTNAKARNTVLSTDEELTGTGTPGATVKVTVKNPEGTTVISEKTTQVGADGNWKLGLDKGLNSNEILGGNAASNTFYAPKNKVEVTQVVNGVSSAATAVTVSEGASTILPSAAAKDGKSVVAGAKEVTVTIPHDAGIAYFWYTNKNDNSKPQIDIKREADGNFVISGNNAGKATVKNVVKGAFSDTVTLTLTEPAKEGANLEIIPHNGLATKGTYLGRANIPVTNEKPVVSSATSSDETVVPMGGTVNLSTLAKVTDHEDDQNATLGTKGTPRVVSINGDTNKTTLEAADLAAPGTYTVKYKAVDSQGKESAEYEHTVKVNQAPTVEVPYSNAAKRQIYIYTGENTELTFTGKDETEVKDLYLRGTVNNTGDNAAAYGLTTGKVENGVVAGEGSVSDDKRTATIKMTGTTNLPAGQKWTSFIEAKDSDNVKSMPSNQNYNVENDDDAARQQKPGYVQFIVKSQTDKYDIKAPTEKVAVTDPANVTEADLAKVKEKLQLEYNQDNDDANIAKDTAVDKNGKIQSVTKDADGNLVVTYTDGSKDTRPLSEFVTLDKQPAIDAVKKAAEAKIDEINKTPNATDDEKQAAINKVNADKKKALDEIAKPEVTTKDALDKAQTAGTDAIAKDNPVVAKKDEAKKAIDDALKAKEAAIAARPDLTDDEKKAAKDAAKAAADKAKGAVDTATTNAAVDKAKADGTTAVANVTPVAKAEAKKAINDALTAKNKEIDARPDLTDEEKTAAKNEAKDKADAQLAKINEQPDAATTPTAAKTAQDAVDAAKKTGVAEVTAVNPVAVKKPAAKKAIDNALKAKEAAIDARPDLTPEEKKAAKDAAKAAADKAKAAVDVVTTDAAVDAAKGTGTGDIAKVNPVAKEAAKKAVADELAKKEAAIDGRKDLTDEEKAAAKKEAQDKAKEATDAINTQPSNAETPEKAAEAQKAVDGAKDKGVADVKAVNPEAVTKPAAKKAIEDKLAKQLEEIANTPDATDEEKKVAEDAAKAAAEKAKEEIDKAETDAAVEAKKDEAVGKDGAKGTIDKLPVVEDKPNARKAIEDEAKAKKEAIDARQDLTPEAKAKLKAKVDKIAKKAKEGIDAVTSKTDVDVIKEADKAAIKAIGEVNRPIDKVLVKDPSALTDEEKAKILEEVKKVNPTAKEVKYDENGNIEVTTEAGDKGIINPTKLVKTEDQLDNGKGGNDINKPLDKVIVKDPSNLTDEEKAKIVAKVEEVNSGAIVTIDENGTVSVSTPEGKTAAIPASDLVRTKEDTAKPDAGNSKIVKPADKVVGEANDPDDQAKVEAKLRELNPETKSVKFDENGNATVTLNDGTTATIPSEDLFRSEADVTKPNAGNDVVKPADKTEVANPDKLTDAEKKAIEDKVKAVNPGATVVVDDKGNATVTTPSGNTAVIPAADLTKTADDAAKPNAGNDVVKPADKTVVANPEKLTDAEKKAIEDKVKAVNPGATVVVDDKGNATVTTPSGNTADIPVADLTKTAEDIFKQRPYVPSNGGGNNSGNGNGTSGNNGATNTDAKVDKAKLEGAIRQLDELIIKESAKLDAETAKEANDLLADAKKVFANADATQAEVNAMVKRIENFMAKVASSTDHATPANDQAAQTPAVAPATAQAAANAGQTASAQANARKAAKELPNTGTADSTVAMVAAAASALLGLGLAGRRRKEDEEA